jgi:hypothetical protein
LFDALADLLDLSVDDVSAPRLRANLDFSSPLTTPITIRSAIFARSINALPIPPAAA